MALKAQKENAQEALSPKQAEFVHLWEYWGEGHEQRIPCAGVKTVQ